MSDTDTDTPPIITALGCVSFSLYEERKTLSLYETWLAQGVGGESIQSSVDMARARVAQLEATYEWLQQLEL